MEGVMMRNGKSRYIKRGIRCFMVYENESRSAIFLFVEKASKVLPLAYDVYEEYFEYTYYDFGDFIKGVSVHRCPSLDDSYRGHTFMDWEDPDDRLDLVKRFDMYCNEEYFDELNCENCAAKTFCAKYEEISNRESK